MKKQARLQFTEEERADPTLEKPIAKSEKAADKVEKAQAKIPKKTMWRYATAPKQGRTHGQMQRAVANSLLTPEQLEMYNVYLQTKSNKPLLFGGGTIDGSPSTDLSGVEFVNGERQGNQNTLDIALSQVGNVGDQPYWSWYGFDYRMGWCACYVSWVLNQAGYSKPKFATCQSQGVPYFSSNERWANRRYKDLASRCDFL